jgi:hypothetical protein
MVTKFKELNSLANWWESAIVWGCANFLAPLEPLAWGHICTIGGQNVFGFLHSSKK